MGAESVLSTWAMRILEGAGVRMGGDIVEAVTSAFFMVPAAVYMHFAGRWFYGQGTAAVALKTLVLAVWFYVVLTGYRFVLFWTTFWSVQ